MEHVLRELGREHLGEFSIVRLSGLTETSDVLALREIARQLKLEHNVDDEMLKVCACFCGTFVLFATEHASESGTFFSSTSHSTLYSWRRGYTCHRSLG